jgi:hypothetical protein
MNSSLFWMRRLKKLREWFVDMVPEMFYLEFIVLQDLGRFSEKPCWTGGIGYVRLEREGSTCRSESREDF